MVSMKASFPSFPSSNPMFFVSSRKVSDRAEFMEGYGFSTAGTLSKQKQGMMLSMSEGKIRKVEQHILSAIDWSGVLSEQSKVEVDATLGMFKASFDIGEEVMTKRFETVKAMHEWLLSMMHSLKSGNVAQTIRKVQQAVKSDVALDKAADKLLVAGNATLGEAVEPVAGKVPDVEDITGDFLALHAPKQAKLPDATICLHKGSLATLASMASSNQLISALLLGKDVWNGKFHAIQMIMTTGPVENLLEHERVLARCKTGSLVPCGAVLVGPSDYPAKHSEMVQALVKNLADSCTSPILVAIDYSRIASGDCYAWEFCGEQKEMRSVGISWVTQSKDRTQRLNYNLCWIDDVGSSHVENATKQIVTAVISKVCGQGSSSQAPDPAKQPYQKLLVPADGFCGWHALIACKAENCLF